MQQQSLPFEDKLDAPLQQLCNDPGNFTLSSPFPIVVRCDRSNLPDIAAEVERLGGRIRHTLRAISAVTAWLPLGSISELAKDQRVSQMELVQTFSIASVA